jgi:hypothetical protein
LSEIVEVHLKWGYQRSTTGTLLYGSLTYLGVAPLKNGNIAGIKWYSNAFSFTVSGVPESTPPIDYILVDGNGYNRTAMMMIMMPLVDFYN